MDIRLLADSVGEAQPLAPGGLETVKGRVLSIDADMLAYQCGGNEDTSVGESRNHALDLIVSMAHTVGADKVILHLTADGSDKGMRYAIAQTRPYQGNRKDKKRPKNLAYLRNWMASGASGYTVKNWHDREADDGMAYLASVLPDHWIATKDKDLRMVPGGHLNWDTRQMIYLEPGQFELRAWDKVFGYKWFWLQMLQGDTADNIPNVVRLFGPAKALKLLDGAEDNLDAFTRVADCYQQHAGDAWADRFAESAALLWMRRDRAADVRDFLSVVPNLGYPGAKEVWTAADRMSDRLRLMKEEACRV